MAVFHSEAGRTFAFVISMVFWAAVFLAGNLRFFHRYFNRDESAAYQWLWLLSLLLQPPCFCMFVSWSVLLLVPD